MNKLLIAVLVCGGLVCLFLPTTLTGLVLMITGILVLMISKREHGKTEKDT